MLYKTLSAAVYGIDANIIQVDAISPILNTLDTCVFTYVAVAPTYDVLPT